MPLFKNNQAKEWNSETLMVGYFRFWHLIALSAGGFIVLVVAFCCTCKCRIPRTRKQIESEKGKPPEAIVVSSGIKRPSRASCHYERRNSRSLRRGSDHVGNALANSFIINTLMPEE